MSYQVPFSSSPPSTPDRRSGNGKKNLFAVSNPSTTPAGPPPSSTGSFTPAGPPPSSYFGSSAIGGTGAIKPLSFGRSDIFNPSQSAFNESNSLPYPDSSLRSSIETQRLPSGKEYQASTQGGFRVPSDDEDDDEVEYAEDDDYQPQAYNRNYSVRDVDAEHDQEDGEYEDDAYMDDYRSYLPGSKGDGQHTISDRLLHTPEDLKRSGVGDALSLRESSPDEAAMFGNIAKDLYSQMGLPEIDESDDLILGTEAIITRLYEDGIEFPRDVQQTLSEISEELTRLWTEYHDRTKVYNSEEYTTSIGPGPNASNFAKADFLAGIALQIHHPSCQPKPKPLAQTMLEWMYTYHDPYPSQFEEVQAHRPSPANHRLFWDTVFNGLLRGKVVAVVNILNTAGWRHARAGLDDIRDTSGFSGQALANVEMVVNAATQVLAQCPAIHGDWNTRGSDWTLFRLRVSQALEELKSFAEGRNRDSEDSAAFGDSRFGMPNASTSAAYSRIARKAESKVPWHIYQNLVTLYNLAMGDTNAIAENAQDWCEATIGLLVWWDEAKDDRRVAISRSRARNAPGELEGENHLRKLRKAFEAATADTTDFEVNTLNPVELGLASLFEGDFEAVIGFLRAWSGPLSSAVAEVAAIGGWLPLSEPQNLITMGSLDEDDMDVLGINPSLTKSDGVKDQTLIAYARSLSRQGTLKRSANSGQPKTTREGWELAVAILGRLDSAARSEEMVSDFLKTFHLDSSHTVDKLWVLLQDIGMGRQAEDTAELYADQLAEGTHNYGEAMWYYALSHKPEKVKDVLDLLISYSLVQSMAFPPAAELDDHLRMVIESPQNTLVELSHMDMEAAELLHKMLSGYATLRRFYDLRDEEIVPTTGTKSRKGNTPKKAEAVAALLAVITSSDDNIRGGLYDEERGAVVSVGFLLALLGEAMVFVNQPDSPITVSQIDILLKAIEDLQAAGPRVYSACTEFLGTVIASATGLKGSSPADMLRKSTSNASGTSSFSMVGSSMLASQLKQSMGGSGVLVKGNIKRGWDWRRGMSATTTGDDVLRILRLGLAQSLAKAWLREADCLV